VTTPEQQHIEQMIASDSVRLRDIGVIAKVLEDEGLTYCDGGALDPIALAKRVIKAQTDTGLVTFIGADLRTHIDEITARARGEIVEPWHGKAPTPEPGLVTSRVKLTRGEFAALARGEYVPGARPVHGPPQTVVDPPTHD
jgi:hypothetical protein